MLTFLLRSILQRRASSAWIASTSKRDPALPKIDDTEKLFLDKDVQELLRKLTGLDLHGKIFRERIVAKQERSHYALMTDAMFQEAVKKKEAEGRNFLQFVPFKEPRKDEFTVLATDPEINGHDTAKFIFTDITFDATNQDRLVVVREPDGVLRTALPEEHDRMNRVYYEQPNRPVIKPKVFTDPELQDALNTDKHEFLLDWACYYFEPDNSEFVKVSRKIFDDIIAKEKYELLRSTRHFGTLVFYMVLNNKLPPLLNYFRNSHQSSNELNEVANVIRLYKQVYKTWQSAVAETDSDHKVVEDFIKQNASYKRSNPDLLRLLDSSVEKKSTKTQRRSSGNQ